MYNQNTQKQSRLSAISRGLPTALLLVCTALALIMGGAHFWRAGQHGLGLACVGLMGLLWTRLAWVRMVTSLVCFALAARWVWVCGSFVGIRSAMGEPWMRLMVILMGVALFTLYIGWMLGRKRALSFAHRYAETAVMSCVTFFLVFAGFGCVYAMAPQVLIAERLAPSYGLLQGFFCAVWGAFVVHHLHDKGTRDLFRMRIWRLFSLVFFGQLFLGLMGYSLFLMSGTLHLPVPAVIVAAPLFRGGGYFMLILFAVSIALVGSAWCSHLCYFGAWDATVSRLGQKRNGGTAKAPAWLPYTAPMMLGVTVLVALALRLYGAPTQAAVMAGLSLGLLCIPASLFISARYGVDGYCVGVCPLGVLARRLRPVQAWRLVFTEHCTQCQRCISACTSMAIDVAALQRGEPHSTCTLCRRCMDVCRHDGCAVSFAFGLVSASQADKVFTVLLASIHSLFLGISMM